MCACQTCMSNVVILSHNMVVMKKLFYLLVTLLVATLTYLSVADIQWWTVPPSSSVLQFRPLTTTSFSPRQFDRNSNRASFKEEELAKNPFQGHPSSPSMELNRKETVKIVTTKSILHAQEVKKLHRPYHSGEIHYSTVIPSFLLPPPGPTPKNNNKQTNCCVFSDD